MVLLLCNRSWRLWSYRDRRFCRGGSLRLELNCSIWIDDWSRLYLWLVSSFSRTGPAVGLAGLVAWRVLERCSFLRSSNELRRQIYRSPTAFVLLLNIEVQIGSILIIHHRQLPVRVNPCLPLAPLLQVRMFKSFALYLLHLVLHGSCSHGYSLPTKA